MINDINTVIKLSNALKLLNFLKMSLTVGIIAFTVFRIINIMRQKA